MDSDRIDWASLKKIILGSSEKSPNIFSFFFLPLFQPLREGLCKGKIYIPQLVGKCLASVWQVVAGSH